MSKFLSECRLSKRSRPVQPNRSLPDLPFDLQLVIIERLSYLERIRCEGVSVAWRACLQRAWLCMRRIDLWTLCYTNVSRMHTFSLMTEDDFLKYRDTLLKAVAKRCGANVTTIECMVSPYYQRSCYSGFVCATSSFLRTLHQFSQLSSLDLTIHCITMKQLRLVEQLSPTLVSLRIQFQFDEITERCECENRSNSNNSSKYYKKIVRFIGELQNQSHTSATYTDRVAHSVARLTALKQLHLSTQGLNIATILSHLPVGLETLHVGVAISSLNFLRRLYFLRDFHFVLNPVAFIGNGEMRTALCVRSLFQYCPRLQNISIGRVMLKFRQFVQLKTSINDIVQLDRSIERLLSCAPAFQLRTLRLTGTICSVSSEMMLNIPEMRNLHTLEIRGMTDMTDDILEKIVSGCRELQSLALVLVTQSGEQITSQGLCRIASLRQLNTLQLVVKVKDFSTGPLRNEYIFHEACALLSLNNESADQGIPVADDSVIRSLVDCETPLRELKIFLQKPTHYCVISDLKDLTELDLSRTGVTEESLIQIVRGCDRIRMLDLESTKLPCSAYRHICNLQHLKHLNLRKTQILREQVEMIWSACKNLEFFAEDTSDILHA